MAHELATTDGRTAMMYAGDIPWHGLGTQLDQPATAREAIDAAGLNYLAELKGIETTDGVPIPQRKAVVRSDSGDVLGVVGTSYVPVQNHQAFGFLDAVVADGSLRYHTAGALGKGERVWMLAKLPDDIRVRYRHQPFIEQLFHVQIGVVAAPEAQGDVHGIAREIDRLARGVKAQRDVRALPTECADPRQQPHLQE